MSREDRRRQQIKRAIERDSQGRTVTVQRTSESYDPSTGSTTTTTTESTVIGTPPKDFTEARIDGTLIQAGDTVIQIPAAGLDLGTPDEPKSTDDVKLGGLVWGIVQIGEVPSGEKVGAYTLHLRR